MIEGRRDCNQKSIFESGKKKVFRSAEVGKAETLKEAFQKDLQKKGQEH